MSLPFYANPPLTPTRMNEPKLTAKTLQPLIEEMELLFDGDLQIAVDCFDEVLHALFYVDKEVIPQERIQDIVYNIQGLQKALKQTNRNLTRALPSVITMGLIGEA
jgi:hypothetical protein